MCSCFYAQHRRKWAVCDVPMRWPHTHTTTKPTNQPTLRTQANGENNNDGSNDNFSWNCGAEGEHGATEAVHALRFRQMRNFMLALIASQGVPMMVMGGCRSNLGGGPCAHTVASWSLALRGLEFGAARTEGLGPRAARRAAGRWPPLWGVGGARRPCAAGCAALMASQGVPLWSWVGAGVVGVPGQWRQRQGWGALWQQQPAATTGAPLTSHTSPTAPKPLEPPFNLKTKPPRRQDRADARWQQPPAHPAQHRPAPPPQPLNHWNPLQPKNNRRRRDRADALWQQQLVRPRRPHRTHALGRGAGAGARRVPALLLRADPLPQGVPPAGLRRVFEVSGGRGSFLRRLLWTPFCGRVQRGGAWGRASRARARRRPGGVRAWRRASWWRNPARIPRTCPPPAAPRPGDITWHEHDWGNAESRFLAWTLHDTLGAGERAPRARRLWLSRPLQA